MKKEFAKIQSKYGRGKIAEVQQFLKNFGFLDGRVDGYYGKQTARAVSMYQKLHPPLIADGLIGPRTLRAMFPNKRKEKKKIIGSGSVYDTSVCKSKFPKETRGNQTQLKRFYGDPARHEPGERLKLMNLPYKMYLSWDASIGVNHIFMHEKVVDTFQEFLEGIKREYDSDSIKLLGLDQYGGAYNHRRMRGAGRWSTHAYGIALDLYPQANQLRWHKPRAVFSRKVYRPMWKIAAKVGLYGLGPHHNYDWMHIQAAWRR